MKIFIFIIIIMSFLSNFSKLINFEEWIKKINNNLEYIRKKDFIKGTITFEINNNNYMLFTLLIIFISSFIRFILLFIYNYYVYNYINYEFLLITFNVLFAFSISNYIFYIINLIKSIKNNKNFINKHFVFFMTFIETNFNLLMIFIFLYGVFDLW